MQRGAVFLPADSELVVDADEEVFLIYTDLQSSSPPTTANQKFHGLGYVNSHTDVLNVQFELKGPQGTSRKRRGNQDKTIGIELAQDTTSLHSRKGDTGSVLWQASLDFAQLILQQSHFPPHKPLIDPTTRSSLHVLELGAGTGLLSISLSSLFRSYVATDIGALVPLIQKNLSINAIHSATAEELDWLTLLATPIKLRPRLISLSHSIDIILVVDCIYHTSLLPALLETIDTLATEERTTVIVVVELRADDVIRTFLELWLATPQWEIHRLGREGALGRPYVIWLGWKVKREKSGSL